MSIDGVAGPVVVITSFWWGRPAVFVAGVPAPRRGTRQFALPATGGGEVDAFVLSAFTDPYPIITINGTSHRTGPTEPVVLRVLTLAPLLLVAIGGALGGLVGAVGVAANLGVTRTQIPSFAKALIMVGVGVIALVTWSVIAFAVTAAVTS
jgi:hypothetical protein